jgi:hypothetical protein
LCPNFEVFYAESLWARLKNRSKTVNNPNRKIEMLLGAGAGDIPGITRRTTREKQEFQ